MIDTVKNLIKNNKGISAIVGAAGVGILAFLAFGFFGIQTLFIDKEVSEANPFDTIAVTAPASAAEAELAASAGSDAQPTPDAAATADDGQTESAAPTIETLVQGDFVDRLHPTSGTASVLSDGTQRFLRFENFTSDNGPDLNVYLRADDGSFIDLGDLKGNIGDQNYEIPADVDLSIYNTVEIWCVRFNVGFGDATLA